MKSEYLNDSCIDHRPLCFSIPQPILHTVCFGAVSGFHDSSGHQIFENKEKSIDLEPIEEIFDKAILDEIEENVKIVTESLQSIPTAVVPDDGTIKNHILQKCDPRLSSEIKEIVLDVIKNTYSSNFSSIKESVYCHTDSRLSAIIGNVHMQKAFLKKTNKTMDIKRITRRVYNQLYISNIPFQPGDSGTCIYVLSPVQGCVGMAIADHPQGGCIATPSMDILKHFKIRIK